MPVVKCVESKQYLQALRNRLPETRVSHSVFTAEYLSSFAPALGLDHDEAVTAGLLHDYCRDLEPASFLEEARQRRLPLSDIHLQEPVLLHGPLAASRCREEFDISETVYDAIYWHTTGKPGWGLLGQALYVADFAEPSRRFPEAEEARTKLRKEGFDSALLYVTEATLRFTETKAVVDPNTQAFFMWLQKTKNAQE
ncbi:MAG: HD domain-containing protein [Candidatus Hydrogenedentes bacterium]|nr:HD domain-containing protein [Candidatus Hydrogenedentota bacterium]